MLQEHITSSECKVINISPHVFLTRDKFSYTTCNGSFLSAISTRGPETDVQNDEITKSSSELDRRETEMQRSLDKLNGKYPL